MDIILIIDNREPDEVKEGLKNVASRCEQLNVGDYLYQDADGNIRLIVERKTISDLQSSLKDGRFREQRSRLLELNCKVMYIIEGKLLQDNCISGALENLALYHNICVVPTANLKQTIQVLCSLYKKVGEKYIPCQSSLFKGRKRNEHQISNLQAMLETISGISPVISKAIVAKYPTPQILVKEFETNSNLLYGFEITPKRKLGPKIAQKIYESFTS